MLLGPVAWSLAHLTGIQEVVGSILRSNYILSWRLVMKSFLRPVSPYRWFIMSVTGERMCTKSWLTAYRKFPKYSDTQKICCNHSKMWTMLL